MNAFSADDSHLANTLVASKFCTMRNKRAQLLLSCKHVEISTITGMCVIRVLRRQVQKTRWEGALQVAEIGS